MPAYTRTEARAWAREKLVGAVNCTIPSFTGDLERINEPAIRHDARLAVQHGFLGTLGVSEVAITLPAGDRRRRRPRQPDRRQVTREDPHHALRHLGARRDRPRRRRQ